MKIGFSLPHMGSVASAENIAHNQLAQDLDIDYKGIEHHLNTLEENNLVTKFGGKYGATYFVSPLFEEAEALFDEIVTKLKKVGGPEWSR